MEVRGRCRKVGLGLTWSNLVQGGAEGKASTDKGEARETAMKVTIDIDCTPEEARAFLGLPDLGPAQRAYVEEFQKRMMVSLGTMDPGGHGQGLDVRRHGRLGAMAQDVAARRRCR